MGLPLRSLFLLLLFTQETLPKDCEDPGFFPSSSRVSYYNDSQPQSPYEIHYFCHNGYSMIGANIMKCQSGNGLWSVPKPTCVRSVVPKAVEGDRPTDRCRDPGIPTASVRFTYYNNSKLEVGAVMRYTCNEGYALRGRKKLKCLPSGEWSKKTPHCEAVFKKLHVPKTCPPPLNIPNGTLVMGSEDPERYLVGAQALYQCDANFKMQGSSIISCTSSERWDNPAPQCVPEEKEKPPRHQGRHTRCKLPPAPEHGVYTITVRSSMPVVADDNYHPGTVLTYRCTQDLYTLKVNRLRFKTFERICLRTGSWSASEPRCEIECGKSKYAPAQNPFIVFGTKTEKGAWPWQAAISVFPPDSAIGNQLICGGTLISKQWVLTAAHCLCFHETTTTYPQEWIKVHLGKYFRNDTEDDADVQSKTPVAIYVHDNYNIETRAGDIGLILLYSPVTYTEWVIPACLPNPAIPWPTSDNQPGIVTGWGYNEDVTPSAELRRGIMKWAKPEDCEKTFTDNKKVLSDMYCAVEANEGGWSCRGDSGGPMLLAEGPQDDRRYIAEGIVGWGNEKCTTFSAVFVRVRTYLNWIASYASIEII